MVTSIKESNFGDIILWNEIKKKFVSVRNYYKLPNLLKTNNFEICCMSLGNGSFASLFDMPENESDERYTWYEAMNQVKDYKGPAPIKPYLPSINELEFLYLFIKEFNNKINKLQSLGIVCDEIKLSFYWSSTEYISSSARLLFMFDGYVDLCYKGANFYVRAFVAF